MNLEAQTVAVATPALLVGAAHFHLQASSCGSLPRLFVFVLLLQQRKEGPESLPSTNLAL